MNKKTDRAITIIVRLWSEWIGSDQAEWRGSLCCVQSGELIYFQTLHEMMKGVAQVAGERPFSITPLTNNS